MHSGRCRGRVNAGVDVRAERRHPDDCARAANVTGGVGLFEAESDPARTVVDCHQRQAFLVEVKGLLFGPHRTGDHGIRRNFAAVPPPGARGERVGSGTCSRHGRRRWPLRDAANRSPGRQKPSSDPETEGRGRAAPWSGVMRAGPRRKRSSWRTLSGRLVPRRDKSSRNFAAARRPLAARWPTPLRTGFCARPGRLAHVRAARSTEKRSRTRLGRLGPRFGRQGTGVRECRPI